MNSCLLAAVMALAVACGPKEPSVSAPTDWSTTKVAECCTIQHPASLQETAPAGIPATAAVTTLSGHGVQAFIEVLPAEFDLREPVAKGPEARSGYRDEGLRVDGHDGRLIRYASDMPEFVGGETLVAWLDATARPARQVKVTVQCRTAADCADAEVLIRSMRFAKN